MSILLGLVALLLLMQLYCNRLARRKVAHMMRPGDDWEPEDLDRWLALIEPFDLEEVSRP